MLFIFSLEKRAMRFINSSGHNGAAELVLFPFSCRKQKESGMTRPAIMESLPSALGTICVRDNRGKSHKHAIFFIQR